MKEPRSKEKLNANDFRVCLLSPTHNNYRCSFDDFFLYSLQRLKEASTLSVDAVMSHSLAALVSQRLKKDG